MYLKIRNLVQMQTKISFKKKGRAPSFFCDARSKKSVLERLCQCMDCLILYIFFRVYRGVHIKKLARLILCINFA